MNTLNATMIAVLIAAAAWTLYTEPVPDATTLTVVPQVVGR